MSGESFTGGPMPHEPVHRIPDGLYSSVEKNIVYGCTDVALRDPKTGKIFLGSRQTEPQIGPWFVGGRNTYGKGISENASTQVQRDVHLEIDPDRFVHIGTYSTDFPIASPGREEHGRHTLNAVMLADLTPQEVKLLKKAVRAGELRDEYSDGEWYSVSEIADPSSDFAYVLKQFVRDLHQHETAMQAILEEAHDENEVRDAIAQEEQEAKEEEQRVAAIALMLGISTEEAESVEHRSGPYAARSAFWARSVIEKGKYSGDNLAKDLNDLAVNSEIGDVEIRRSLRKLGVKAPKVDSDNGPALRAILSGAARIIEINKTHKGAVMQLLGKLAV